jgi:hypothetical protein
MARTSSNYAFDFIKPVVPPVSPIGQARNYLAFDIEIAGLMPDGDEDWKAHRPLGISCAATLSCDGDLRVWHGKTASGAIADRMSISENQEMVAYLKHMTEEGYTVLTWNGMGFDFDVLAEESGELEICKELAWVHVDMMFHVFCIKGYALGLNKAAIGMGLAGKTPGMSGDLAPRYWAEGKKKEVLEYVSQDVRMTLELAQAVVKSRQLRWTSDSGKPQVLPLPGGFLPVRDADCMPKPDTSWMKTPWSRSKFTGWTGKKLRIG